MKFLIVPSRRILRSPSRAKLALMSLFSMLMCSGCSFVVDVDDLTQGEFCDVSLNLQGFAAHTDDLFELTLVSTDPESENLLRAFAIIDPLPRANVEISLPLAMGAGPHSLDFFSDENNDGIYSDPMPGGDHTWREATDCSSQPVTFTHNINFDILPPPIISRENFFMSLRNMPTTGRAFEMRVTNIETGQTVGLFRKERLMTLGGMGSFDVNLPGTVDTGFSYLVEFWYDTNGNSAFDLPPTDQAWRVEVSGSNFGDGGRFVFDTEGQEDNVDIGNLLVGM